MNIKRIEQLKRFIEQDPDDPFSHYALALEHDAGGETSTAIGILETMLERFPSYGATYQLLGTLYAKTQATSKARAILRMGIQVARDASDAHAASEMQEALDELDG